ncbi:S-adenosyl-L-methionine-dependent methyltransferase [Colletotrichum godetiae]|uniref:S-adenosyl-L-methionine-dependent methyltransferase n=1 Tax=Colletotrichum godetiae TaxID=1209918 RepID=A0AAJ0EPH9_9PEZI|nr:S-adenosyl-L-methionine-dependent methyltransferase [Colletotrichum godetiae]KAK1671706.1 S-adenosyl-L-methionine-dependent methyltransferase [Colletotrichum godetiae]
MSIERALNVTSTAEAQILYDDWAENYDRDLLGADQNYVAPVIASQYVVKYVGLSAIAKSRVLDAGCGTGLVGANLAKLGATQIDGIDLSQGMLKVAERSGVYQSLSTTDLSKPLSQASNYYDAVVCVGTMTEGHVGPEAFDEFVRIVRPGGFIVATVYEAVWEKNGYKEKIASLDKSGKVKLLSDQLEDYRRGKGARAIMVVLQVY